MISISIQDYINNRSRNDDPYNYLPLCHTTPEGAFASIISSKELKATKCDKYGEDLLYLFYGKSSYLIDKDNLPNVNAGAPIALLYDFNDIEKYGFKRILPFDSGAFPRYGFPLKTERRIFEINDCTRCNGIADLVETIYGGNAAYISEKIDHEKLKSASKLSWAIGQIAGLYKRLFKDHNGNLGRQALTIEIQLDKSIDLKPLMILFPYDLLTEANPERIWTEENLAELFPGSKIVIYNRPDEWLTEVSVGMDIETALRRKVISKVKEYVNISI